MAAPRRGPRGVERTSRLKAQGGRWIAARGVESLTNIVWLYVAVLVLAPAFGWLGRKLFRAPSVYLPERQKPPVARFESTGMNPARGLYP